MLAINSSIRSSRSLSCFSVSPAIWLAHLDGAYGQVAFDKFIDRGRWYSPAFPKQHVGEPPFFHHAIDVAAADIKFLSRLGDPQEVA